MYVLSTINTLYVCTCKYAYLVLVPICTRPYGSEYSLSDLAPFKTG